MCEREEGGGRTGGGGAGVFGLLRAKDERAAGSDKGRGLGKRVSEKARGDVVALTDLWAWARDPRVVTGAG